MFKGFWKYSMVIWLISTWFQITLSKVYDGWVWWFVSQVILIGLCCYIYKSKYNEIRKGIKEMLLFLTYHRKFTFYKNLFWWVSKWWRIVTSWPRCWRRRIISSASWSIRKCFQSSSRYFLLLSFLQSLFSHLSQSL